MYSTTEVAHRLRESLETIEWAVSEIPEEYHHALPDFYAPEEWHAGMNLAHLVVYEEQRGNPVLDALAEGGNGVSAVRSVSETSFYGDSLTVSTVPLTALIERLRVARSHAVEVVEAFDEARFNEAVCPLWGVTGRHGAPLQPPGWVAMKTFQHSWEHGNALLRLALFAPR